MSSALALLLIYRTRSGLGHQALFHTINYFYQGHAFAGSACCSQPLFVIINFVAVMIMSGRAGPVCSSLRLAQSVAPSP